MSHRYTKETLYHFQCESCDQWWTIGDWHRSVCFAGELSCPNCGAVASCVES